MERNNEKKRERERISSGKEREQRRGRHNAQAKGEILSQVRIGEEKARETMRKGGRGRTWRACWAGKE